MKKNKAKKNRGCALKIDMMKAYDRVEWDYLEAVMGNLGFNPGWISSVMKSVRTVSFSVLFNGDQLENFKLTRGTRQGDPISPYLFLLAAEGLSSLLKQRGNNTDSIGLKVSPTTPVLSRLLLADVSLLFLKASTEAAKEVVQVLDLYCRASGQRVNLEKSSIFSANVSQMI